MTTLCGKELGNLGLTCSLLVHDKSVYHRIEGAQGGSVAWVDSHAPDRNDVADPATGETYLEMYTRFLA